MHRSALLIVVMVMLGAGCAGSRTNEPSLPQVPPPAAATSEQAASGQPTSGQPTSGQPSAIVIDPILPAGLYRCVVTDGPAALPDSEVTIERQGDRVVAIPKSGRRLEGYLYGTRLALVSATVREIGIEVLQVQASHQPDGTFAGTIERLRDGVLIERRKVVFTR